LADVPARWTKDKGGVAVGLATISIVGAALLFSAEHVRTGPMERYLNISPDGGDGSMEILFLVALVAIVVLGASRLATK
jgi:hypothetical protein